MARKLVLAEKPAVARDLARALGITARQEGSFADDRYVITYCIGHLIELAEPAEYDGAWRRWSLATLPMLPQQFQLRPSRSTAQQWKVVKQLLGRRDFAAVINACDAGREGELIFRYCYELAGCRLPIERLWISSLTDQAIAQGFARLRPGRELEPLFAAARCRSEADWLVGMNATRAVTLWRRSEQDVLCSLGRVQTPTLGLLTAREKAIVEFVPRDYFEVHAGLHRADASSAEDKPFTAIWKHGNQKRLSTRELAQDLASRDQPLPAVIEAVEEKTVREPPPLLFDLGSLQQTANRRFGWSAQRTLGIAQALYEQHKLLTYPRTDSRYLSSDLVPQLPKIFAAVTQQPAFAPFLPALQAARPPRRVFQDSKVSDHHAIIPTPVAHTPARLAALSPDESKLLDLVVRRFLAAFFPDAEFLQTKVVVRVGEVAAPAARSGGSKPAAGAAADFVTELPPLPDRYYAQGRVRVRAGWQEVAGILEERANKGPGPKARGVDEAGSAEDGGEADADADPNQQLPRLQPGQLVRGMYEVKAKQTQPPPRYTEATLLAAMAGAGKQLDDEALQEAMKERGLGTPATRAAIIETLLDRGYITRAGKQLQPTPLGLDLIARLPVPSLGSAQLTGEWEARLSRMARGEGSRAEFMADIGRYVQELVTAVKNAPAPAAVALTAPAQGARTGAARARGASGSSRTTSRTRTRAAIETSAGEPPASSPKRRSRKTSAATRTGASARTTTAAARTKKPGTRKKVATASSFHPEWQAASDFPLPLAGEGQGEADRGAGAPSPSLSRKRERGRTASSRRSTQLHPAEPPAAPAPRTPPVRPTPLTRPMPPTPPTYGATAAPPPQQTMPRPAPPPVQHPVALPVAVGRPVEPALACPRCRSGHLIWGRRAWGCSNFRACPLVIPYDFRGRHLGERDLRNLIERGESLPMLLQDTARGLGEVRARLRLSLAGEPDGFVTVVPV